MEDKPLRQSPPPLPAKPPKPRPAPRDPLGPPPSGPLNIPPPVTSDDDRTTPLEQAEIVLLFITGPMADWIGRNWHWCTAIFFSAVFIATAYRPPGLKELLSYLALFVVTICGVYFAFARLDAALGDRLPLRGLRGGRWVLAIFMAFAITKGFAQIDFYFERWSQTSDSGAKYSYVDKTSRRGRLLNRSVTVRQDGQPTICYEGGFSESRKRHGPWTEMSYDDFHVTRTWYWYGEEVSEGEWHKLNR